ncbi:unnamed protein product [Clonostachys rhizophaga]|uniref:Chromo domain-containing protein n=1 Tax=Clonostachys rhizophaga TaxID=160324 RepID=A0A9N9VHQ5_9HYPO|nr:unnamed protein product [Clonostachys rhizophaga]
MDSLKSNHPPLSPTVEPERGLEIALQATSIATSDTAPGSMIDLEASNSKDKNSHSVQYPKKALFPTPDIGNTIHSPGDQHDLDNTYGVQELVEIYKDRNHTLFLIRWANGGTTWEPEENINNIQLIDNIIKNYQGFKNRVEVEKTRVKNGKLEYCVRFKDYIGSEKDLCWWISENIVHPDNRKRGVRLSPALKDPYRWVIRDDQKKLFEPIFVKTLSSHSINTYRLLPNGVKREAFRAVPIDANSDNNLSESEGCSSAMIDQMQSENNSLLIQLNQISTLLDTELRLRQLVEETNERLLI